MRPLHIIIRMAGEGNRFKKEGWTTPKPLVELNAPPPCSNTPSAVSLQKTSLINTYCSSGEHIETYSIDERIKSFLPKARVFSVKKTTQGVVETCLVAEFAISDEDGIVVKDCDLEFRSMEFQSIIREILSTPADQAHGGSACFF